MLNLTVIIITKNEEDNLEKCIRSFNNIVKRFVIVDSYSTDGTKFLCKNLRQKYNLNIDFYEHEFVTHASQINWALENTNIETEWTMRIDADEELTVELVKEINEKLDTLDKDINGLVLKRRTYFMGKWIKHGGVYPTKLLRIFRTGKAICEPKIMDEHMVLKEGKLIELDFDFIDNNTKDLEWWIRKHNWYSNKEVLDYQKNVIDNDSSKDNLNLNRGQAAIKRKIKNNGYYKLPLFFRAWFYYFYRYYLKLGFLDGNEGRIYHFLQAYWYRFLVDAKIYECEKLGIKMSKQGDLK